MRRFNVASLRKKFTRKTAILLILLIIIFFLVIFSLMEFCLFNAFSQNRFIEKFVCISVIEKILFIISILMVSLIILVYEKQKKYYDYLTNLYLIEKMYIDLSKCISKLSCFYIAYIDLDDFSKVNSKYGHLKANKLLLEFSKNALNLSEDISWYRVGGDEFLAIIGSGKYDICTNIQKLYSLSNQIITIECDIKEDIILSSSIGIAEYSIDSKNADELIAIADRRMYKAKSKKNKKV